MLEALLNNKLKSKDEGYQYEDVLTSSVIGRLKYLSGPTLWRVLFFTCRALPEFRFASLEQIQFWPQWKLNENRVEPDVFLELSLGDPIQRFHIIIEAKADGISKEQSKDQWGQQISAYEKLLDENELEPGTLHFIALGGKPVKKAMLLDKYNIHQASWFDFYSACQALIGQGENVEFAVLNDICNFLSWSGFFPFLPLGEMQLPEKPMFDLNAISLRA